MYNSDIVCCTSSYDRTIEAYKAQKVAQLGNSTGHNDFGWVVLSHSRSGNIAMHKWYTTDVLIPFIKEQRCLNGLPEDSIAFYQLDGELAQISCFQESDILDLLNRNHICVGKLPAF